MTKYFTIMMDNGVQGSYYKTREEAQDAANKRNALHGRLIWTVQEVWLADLYADDNRPYRTRR